jgi:hypothetical protein
MKTAGPETIAVLERLNTRNLFNQPYPIICPGLHRLPLAI